MPGAAPSFASPQRGQLLLVDDSRTIRSMVCRQLENDGHTVVEAQDGEQALELLRQHDFDLVLLDLIMPRMDGRETLQELKRDPLLRDVPVIMLSASDEIDSTIQCIEAGAEDYLHKPFNETLLRARISACLEKKRFRDREKAFLEQLRTEQQESERLLLNILPAAIAQRLKAGERSVVDSFSEVTVLFADLAGFSQLGSRLAPKVLVAILNNLFSSFDQLAERYGVEKIKTIGDAYMVAGGLPVPQANHVEAVASMALDMLEVVETMCSKTEPPIELRIGIHSGPVVAGIIGTRKFAYDLWGDTVNIASRMESHGQIGRIQVSETVYRALTGKFDFESRGAVDIKGMGPMQTYFLNGRLG